MVDLILCKSCTLSNSPQVEGREDYGYRRWQHNSKNNEWEEVQTAVLFFYLVRDRLDGVVKANTVLIHHPQSFLEGLLKAAANSHHLTCQEKWWWRSTYCHCWSVLMWFYKYLTDGSSFKHQSIQLIKLKMIIFSSSYQHSSWSCQSWWKLGGTCWDPSEAPSPHSSPN